MARLRAFRLGRMVVAMARKAHPRECTLTSQSPQKSTPFARLTGKDARSRHLNRVGTWGAFPGWREAYAVIGSPRKASGCVWPARDAGRDTRCGRRCIRFGKGADLLPLAELYPPFNVRTGIRSAGRSG